jgi:hypothetical protein
VAAKGRTNLNRFFQQNWHALLGVGFDRVAIAENEEE